MVMALPMIASPESLRTDQHLLLSKILDFPKLEDQVSLFVSLRNTMSQLYLQEPPVTICRT
jgi:hypothetical protein